jgi:hypothetical protein
MQVCKVYINWHNLKPNTSLYISAPLFFPGVKHECKTFLYSRVFSESPSMVRYSTEKYEVTVSFPLLLRNN